MPAQRVVQRSRFLRSVRNHLDKYRRLLVITLTVFVADVPHERALQNESARIVAETDAERIAHRLHHILVIRHGFHESRFIQRAVITDTAQTEFARRRFARIDTEHIVGFQTLVKMAFHPRYAKVIEHVIPPSPR